MLPKIKKRLKSFILEEEGRISKQSVLTIGAILATLGLATTIGGTHECPNPGSCDGCSCGSCSCGGSCCGCGCGSCCG